MKKIIVLTFLILLSITTIAQNKFGQTTITFGPSYSLFRGVHKVPFSDYEKHFRFTVGGQFHFDWAPLRRVSFGGGITHQRHQLEITNYQYTLNGLTITENPRQTIDVTGYYFRGLLHFKDVFESSLEEIDLYWGAQQYFLLYRSFSNSKDPDFFQVNESIQAIPGILGGIRYYPTENFGVHAEIAFPGPYSFSVGGAIRLGGRDKLFR